jgi:hypothetical protein
VAIEYFKLNNKTVRNGQTYIRINSDGTTYLSANAKALFPSDWNEFIIGYDKLTNCMFFEKWVGIEDIRKYSIPSKKCGNSALGIRSALKYWNIIPKNSTKYDITFEVNRVIINMSKEVK